MGSGISVFFGIRIDHKIWDQGSGYFLGSGLTMKYGIRDQGIFWDQD